MESKCEMALIAANQYGLPKDLINSLCEYIDPKKGYELHKYMENTCVIHDLGFNSDDSEEGSNECNCDDSLAVDYEHVYYTRQELKEYIDMLESTDYERVEVYDI